MPLPMIHIAERVFNRPLLIHPAKAEVILQVIGSRLGADFEIDLDAPEMSRFVGTRARPDGSYSFNSAESGVAIIPIIGSLVNRGAWIGARSGMTSYEGLAAQVDDAVSDKSIHSIILDVDSPGGEATGMLSLAAKVRAAAQVKRVVAVVNDMASSAAYGIASAANEIVVSPTSVTGSIGVVLLHADRSGEMAQRGIKPTLIFAGAHKADGNPFGPLSDAVRAELQRDVHAIYDQFLAAVAAGRGERLPEDRARATEARTYIGAEAIAVGLADRVAAFDEVLNELTTAPHTGRIQNRRNVRMTKETGAPEATNAGITSEQLNAAVAEAARAAATAERARIQAILGSEEAKGREAVAMALALDGDMSADAAKKVLANVAKLSPTIESRANAMPEIGPAGGAPAKPDAEAVKAGWGSAFDRTPARRAN